MTQLGLPFRHPSIPDEHTEPYWRGRLSTALAIGVDDIRRGEHKWAGKHMQECLREFIASPVPSEQLKKDLREYLKEKKR